MTQTVLPETVEQIGKRHHTVKLNMSTSESLSLRKALDFDDEGQIETAPEQQRVILDAYLTECWGMWLRYVERRDLEALQTFMSFCELTGF